MHKTTTMLILIAACLVVVGIAIDTLLNTPTVEKYTFGVVLSGVLIGLVAIMYEVSVRIEAKRNKARKLTAAKPKPTVTEQPSAT